MKKIFPVLLSILMIMAITAPVIAFESIENVIQDSPLSKTAIVAVSVKNAKTGKSVYERNSGLLLHPASVVKALTTPVVIETLGKNYKLKTQVYRFNKDIYIKLGADPFLTYEDLNSLIKACKEKGLKKINGQIYIDNSIIDNIEWGKGWMWDDETSPYIPKISPYNINHNLFTLKITPASKNQPTKIETNYPISFINNVISSDTDNITIEKLDGCKKPDFWIKGTVSKPIIKEIPVDSPRHYFAYNLKKALRTNKIRFKNNIKTSKIPKNAVLLGEASHDLLEAIDVTNHNSDNLSAETLFKIAGSEFTKTQGSTETGFDAFNDYYKNLGLDAAKILFVDASGVSHYNLINAQWISQALHKIYQTNLSEIYLQTLAQPTQKGSLEDRLTELNSKLYAKTGTLSGVSTIAGYVKSNSSEVYCFSIMIQNFKGSSKPAKDLEDEIIRILLKREKRK